MLNGSSDERRLLRQNGSRTHEGNVTAVVEAVNRYQHEYLYRLEPLEVDENGDVAARFDSQTNAAMVRGMH